MLWYWVSPIKRWGGWDDEPRWGSGEKNKKKHSIVVDVFLYFWFDVDVKIFREHILLVSIQIYNRDKVIL